MDPITFTFTLDFFRNAFPDDIGNLYKLLIDKKCVHSVAVDDENNLLKAYQKNCKRGEEIASWVDFITHKTYKYTPIDYLIDPDTVEDKDILGLTFEVVGDRMMVVDSLQSTKGYIKQDEVNNGEDVRIVSSKLFDNIINEGNVKNITNNTGCMIAYGSASINGSSIKTKIKDK